jgi:pimeloyl-ACP methyl ester carboxylesterase
MRDSIITAAPHRVVHAEVRVRDRVMRYNRSGGGVPVVVLGAPGAPDLLWPELHEALAGGFRLIVPELPRCDEDVAAWLAAFLEGLGTPTVRVVASSDFCMSALELALADLDRISRVVLVPRGEPSTSGLAGDVATVARSTVPLLVVRRGVPAVEAVPLVLSFLAGGDAAAPAPLSC